MLWLISLFKPTLDTSLEALARFERRIIPRYTEFYQQIGFSYIGAYSVDSRTRFGSATPATPWGELPYTHAEVFVVDAPSAEQARTREAAVSLPGNIQEMLAERNAYLDVNDGARLWLEPLALSPVADSRLTLANRLLGMLLYQPMPDKRLEDFVAFEQRITARYAGYMREAGWHYAGVYHAHGLQAYMRADLYALDAATPEEAVARDNARDEAGGVPKDVEEIIAECRTYMNRQIERYVLWLRPVALSSTAESGVVLGQAVSESKGEHS